MRRIGCCRRLPRPSKFLLDKAANQATHDLRGREVLALTQFLEHGFLFRVDQQCQARGAVFENHAQSYPFTEDVHRMIMKYILCQANV